MKKLEYKIEYDVGIDVCERCGKTAMLHTHKEKLTTSWNVCVTADFCQGCIDIIEEASDKINDYIDKIDEQMEIINKESE